MCLCGLAPVLPTLAYCEWSFLSHFCTVFLSRSGSLLLAFYILILCQHAATMDDYCCCDDVIGWPWRRSPFLLSFSLYGMLYCCLLPHWCESGERSRTHCSAAIWQCTVHFVSLAGFIPPEGVSHWQIASAISSASSCLTWLHVEVL